MITIETKAEHILIGDSIKIDAYEAATVMYVIRKSKLLCVCFSNDKCWEIDRRQGFLERVIAII